MAQPFAQQYKELGGGGAQPFAGQYKSWGYPPACVFCRSGTRCCLYRGLAQLCFCCLPRPSRLEAAPSFAVFERWAAGNPDSMFIRHSADLHAHGRNRSCLDASIATTVPDTCTSSRLTVIKGVRYLAAGKVAICFLKYWSGSEGAITAAVGSMQAASYDRQTCTRSIATRPCKRTQGWGTVRGIGAHKHY